MKQTILVTGAGGFIGSAVTRVLSKKANVIALTSPFSSSDRITSLRDLVLIKKVDLSDANKVKNLIKSSKPDIVVHLATHGVYTYQQADEDRISIDNYKMTSNLLNFSSQFGVKKFINTGSVFEYGSQKRKVNESDVDLIDVLNRYSAVKMATTALANSYANKLQVITLRPFTTYGPTEDKTRFVRATIQRALNNEPIRIVKDVVRDFVYVDDVADAYLRAVLVDYQSGEIINIAGGKKYSLEKVSNLIKKITNSKSQIIFDEKYVRGKESACWADIRKAKKILSWKPKTSLDMGLNKTIDWMK